MVFPSVSYAGRGFFDMQIEKPVNWLCQAGFFIVYNFAAYMKLNL